MADLLLVQMTISGQNSHLGHIPRRRLESVMPKYSIKHILLKTLDSSSGAVPVHNPCKDDHLPNNCNCRFQTEMSTKRQNLRTAALSFNVPVWLSGRTLRQLSERLWVRFQGNTCTNKNV